MLEKLKNKKEAKETDKKVFVPLCFGKEMDWGGGKGAGNIKYGEGVCQEFAFLIPYPL